MPIIRFQPGEIVFREGDPPGELLVVKSGSAELQRLTPAGPVAFAVVREGALLGEIAAGEPRLATALALTALEVEPLSREALSAAMSLLGGPPLAPAPEPGGPHEARAARPGPAEPPAAPAPDAEAIVPAKLRRSAPIHYGSVRLVPGSPRLVEVMPSDGIEVTQFPFRVGRHAGKGEHGPALSNHLELPDDEPYQLSRLHFALDDAAWGPVVVDCGSRLGTRVNGHLIGGNAEEVRAPLNPGENEVIAGSRNSPFRFRVFVQPDGG